MPLERTGSNDGPPGREFLSMLIPESVVVVCLAAIVYTYAGYPVLLMLLTVRRRTPTPPNDYFPRATVLVPAHNEESVMGDCLSAVLASAYEVGRLDVVVVSDASTDRTEAIVATLDDPRLRLVSLPRRLGKDSALITVRDQAAGDILIVMDASTIVARDGLSSLVRHFGDAGVGAVCGRKTIDAAGTAVAKADGLYWRYDALLRRLESRSGSSRVGVEGGLFAIRKALFDVDLGHGLAADLSLGFRIEAAGLRTLYEPDAGFHESASDDMATEFSRKIRVIVRGMRAFNHHRRLLSPRRHPALVFQVVSHKLCRWLVPFFLIGLFGSSLVAHGLLFRMLLAVQSGFYGIALVGLMLGDRAAAVPGLSFPAYFCSMNAAAGVAWLQFARRFDVWSPTRRVPRRGRHDTPGATGHDDRLKSQAER